MKKILLPATLLLGVMFTTAPTNAAVITWGAATNITGVSDVSTNGTLVQALNYGNSGLNSTVNGTLFTGNAIGGAWSNQSVVFGFNASPFNTLTVPYGTLLQSGSNFITATSTSLGLTGLTIGQEYEVQFWVNDSRSIVGTRSTVFDGLVTVRANTTEADGGLGQFVTGKWTADSTGQNIVLSAPDTAITLNAMRLSAVPEPATSLLLGLGGVAAVVVMIKRRRRQAL